MLAIAPERMTSRVALDCRLVYSKVGGEPAKGYEANYGQEAGHPDYAAQP
jgi:hypothetical protein